MTKQQSQIISMVVNGPDNLRPMLARFNSSKWALAVQDWIDVGLGRDLVDHRYLLDAARIQRQVAEAIDAVLGGKYVHPSYYNAKLLR